MKWIIIITAFFCFSGCKKSKESKECTTVTVTLKASSCKHVGVIVNGTAYPSDDLPDQFAVEGKVICIEYAFWDDPKECPCCGGRKVHVISVHQ